MRVRRGELADLYAEGDRCVVMVGESVLVLAEVATAIVEALPEGVEAEVTDVAASVVEAFGEPEPPHTAEGLTLQHVHDLVAHGVLEVVGSGSRDGTSSLLDQRGTASSLLDQRGVDQRGKAVEALRSALRHVRSGDEAAWRLPNGVTADEFVAAAHQHHVVVFLSHRLDRLSLPDRARSVLQADAVRLRAGAHVVAADLARALDALDSAGVRALAFKGVALAVQAHGDLTARGAGDIDLLIAPEDLDQAYTALTDAGWNLSPGYPARGPAWAWRHLVRDHYELALASATSAIDLHWHLVPARETFPGFEVLWSRREALEVGGRAVATLSSYDALVHSASHSAKDRWRWLHSLVDIHLLASRPETWQAADRPLLGDQLLSVGIACRAFGVPPGAPQVIPQAVGRSSQVWERVLSEQQTTPAVQAPMDLSPIFRARAVIRTGASPRDAARLLSRSALPPWQTARESSPHAAVAVPRVLARRTAELARKLRSAALSRSARSSSPG